MKSAVFAKLYKLNIYSDGDFFRAHVDTPKGALMFGSLVVCLPGPRFSGGELRVRHQGQEHVYDWSAEDGENICWAAFYADCEHEISPVTSGTARATLTYNLFNSPLKETKL